MIIIMIIIILCTGVVNCKKPENGKVLLKYVTSHNIEHGRYEDIQPFRRIFGVYILYNFE